MDINQRVFYTEREQIISVSHNSYKSEDHFMAPILYSDIRSPPVRSCLLLIKALNADVTIIPIDLFNGEHKTPEFLKINPMHTVPVLRDDDIILTDSHAILIYIAEKYGKESSWYPKDDKLRIKIINKLFFECSILFRRDSDMMSEIIREKTSNIDHHQEKILEAYGFLEKFLNDHKYIACDVLTIADISIVTTLSTLDLIFPVTANTWPRLYAWYKEMQSLPCYLDMNESGRQALKEALKNFGNYKF